jgi:hypothetical protein
MLYEYQAAIHEEGSAQRLRQLVRRLQAARCEVQYDAAAASLRLRVRDSEDAWMQTALVTMLLLSFKDVVSWGGHSRRVEDRRVVLQLPAVAEGPLQA